jgi:hypothetical protein
MDITALILDDHNEQRRLFAMTQDIDLGNTEALAKIWGRLSALLITHAKAEETFFYPALLDVGTGAGSKHSAAAETKDAIHDHNQIRDAIAAVSEHAVGTERWVAAVAKANEANSDHMGEEEREGLADFCRHADLRARHDLAVAFAAFEAAHLEGVDAGNTNPAKYVAEHS